MSFFFHIYGKRNRSVSSFKDNLFPPFNRPIRLSLCHDENDFPTIRGERSPGLLGHRPVFGLPSPLRMRQQAAGGLAGQFQRAARVGKALRHADHAERQYLLIQCRSPLVRHIPPDGRDESPRCRLLRFRIDHLPRGIRRATLAVGSRDAQAGLQENQPRQTERRRLSLFPHRQWEKESAEPCRHLFKERPLHPREYLPGRDGQQPKRTLLHAHLG